MFQHQVVGTAHDGIERKYFAEGSLYTLVEVHGEEL